MIIKSTPARNAACNAVVGLVDEGSAFANGALNLYRSDSSVLASLNFSVPAFMDSTNGIALANTISDATAILDGTAIRFSVLNRDRSSIYDGTVSGPGGGGDLILNPVSMLHDTTISIVSASFTVPV